MSTLTREQTTQLEQLLRARERTLRGEIREGLLRSDAAHHKDLAGLVSDVGDESVANMLAEVEVAGIDRDVRELREVEEALARLRGGSYGDCADCGEEIELARLQAYPSAARCFRCQSRRERGYAHGGTPTL